MLGYVPFSEIEPENVRAARRVGGEHFLTVGRVPAGMPYKA